MFFKWFQSDRDVKRNYDKYTVRSSYADGEWTNVIGIFLSHLAEEMGYFQEWEAPNDFVWFRDKSPVPTVAIEHENEESSVENEIPKLLRTSSLLKVLITYANPPRLGDVQKKVLEWLKRTSREEGQRLGEFLLLVGDIGEEKEGPLEWRGFVYGPDKASEFKATTDFYKKEFKGPTWLDNPSEATSR